MGNRISPAKAAVIRAALTIASTPNRPERDTCASSQGNRVAAAYAAIVLARGHSRRRYLRRGFLIPGERRGCGDIWVAGYSPEAYEQDARSLGVKLDTYELGDPPRHLGHGLCSTLEGLELADLADVYCSETEHGLLRALDLQSRGSVPHI